MKKNLIVLATLSTLTIAAHAQSNVELYGVLDEGFAHIDHSLSANDQFVFNLNPYNVAGQNQSSVNALVSGGASMSRWGVQGTEELGGGMKAFFKLESAINLSGGQIANNGQTVLDNANQLTTISGASAINGQLFSRAAYVGIGDANLGSIQLGRTTAFSLDQTVEFDPLHGSGLYSPLGFSGQIGGGLGITETTRLDNSIKYENSFNGFGFGLQYKMPQTNSSDAADVGSVLEGMLAYQNGPLSLKLTGSQAKNTPALSFKLFTNDVGLRVSDTTGYMFTGKYDFTPAFALKAGYEHTVQSTPSSSNNWSTQITTYYGMSLGGLVTANAFGSTWGNAPVTTAWIGGGYQYTDNVTLDASYYNINNGGNNHNDQYTIQALSFMADYHFSKRTDVYLGVMFTQYGGPYLAQQEPLQLATNNAIYGAGLRLKF